MALERRVRKQDKFGDALRLPLLLVLKTKKRSFFLLIIVHFLNYEADPLI